MDLGSRKDWLNFICLSELPKAHLPRNQKACKACPTHRDQFSGPFPYIVIVEQDFARFESIATDWGFWDDTYEFAQDRNQRYIDSNFKEIWLEKYGADLLNVRSWNDGWDATLISEQSSLDLKVLERMPDNFRQDTGAGIVVIDGNPLLLGFSKIKGSDGQRPSEG